jgi:ATP-dependent DNA helicase RecG
MIRLEDDRQSNQFKVVIQRAVEKGPLSGPSGDQVGTESAVEGEQAETRLSLQHEQVTLLCRMTADHTAPELMTFVGGSNRSKFREQVLAPLLALGVVEMTIPNKPNSSKQSYRLTAAGRALKAEHHSSDD